MLTVDIVRWEGQAYSVDSHLCSFRSAGSEESFDEIQESDVIRSQPVGQIAFGVSTARLPEVAMVTGEEGEKHIVQVHLPRDEGHGPLLRNLFIVCVRYSCAAILTGFLQVILLRLRHPPLV